MVEALERSGSFAVSLLLHAAILLLVAREILPPREEVFTPPMPRVIEMIPASLLLPKEAPKPLPQAKRVVPQKAAPAPVAPHQPAAVAAAAPASVTDPTPVAAAASAPLTPPLFDVSYLNNPAPDYPASAKRRRIQGTVRLAVEVTAEGRAAHVRVETGSGFAPLDQAALAAVRQWRFVPAKRGSQAVAAPVIVPIEFRL